MMDRDQLGILHQKLHEAGIPHMDFGEFVEWTWRVRLPRTEPYLFMWHEGLQN